MIRPKILYFHKGLQATDEQHAEAATLAADVLFRNADKVNGVIEPCDGVAGDVPQAYQGFPKAQDAIKAWQKELAAKRKATGEKEPPKADSKSSKVKPWEEGKK